MAASKVSQVAIRYEGQVWTRPWPERHNHLIQWLIENDQPEAAMRGEQGFLDESGQFLTRVEAGVVAVAMGQISHLPKPPRLFSEDLW